MSARTIVVDLIAAPPEMFRVVLTRADGMEIPSLLKTRSEALAYFGGALAASPIAEGVRLRVISEKTWIESRPLAEPAMRERAR